MYKKALVAIARDEVSALQVLKEARSRAQKLYVLHVIEPQEIQYSIDPTLTGKLTHALQSQAIESATTFVHELCDSSGVGAAGVEIKISHTATQIRRSAVELDCDLIVVGSHGWRGWQRLLGSTANSVLHGAPVDVLVHRIQPVESD